MKKKKFTASEKREYNEIISTFGGKELVDIKKVRARILEKRKRKTNRVTAGDMRDMFGY